MIVHNFSHATLKGLTMFAFVIKTENRFSFTLSYIYVSPFQGNGTHSHQAIIQKKTFMTLQNGVNHVSMVFIKLWKVNFFPHIPLITIVILCLLYADIQTSYMCIDCTFNIIHTLSVLIPSFLL
jgi:hypothetical protein